MFRKLAFLIGLVLCFSLPSIAQPPDEQFIELNRAGYSEEIYIQTDREIYIAGEHVLLKIQKLSKLTQTPSDVSKVVYVDLLDNFNNSVLQLKLAASQSSASGHFRLPDTLRTGNYLIRSYTSWMQNFSQELFAYKRILVINPVGNFNQLKISEPLQQPDSVIFYPESGNLIAGIQSKIGFRCFDKNGIPVRMNYAIINSNNDTLSHFQTAGNGVGFFTVNPPETGDLYVVPISKGIFSKKFKFPKVQNSGIAISLASAMNQDEMAIKILKNNNFSNIGRKLFFVYDAVSLIAFKNEVVINRDTTVNLRKNSLPAGLAEISIVDDKGHLLAKRWVYNDMAPIINYTVKMQNRTYANREKVELEIAATDIDGKPVESEFLFSVVKSFSAATPAISQWQRSLQSPYMASLGSVEDITNINDYLLFYTAHNNFPNQNSLVFNKHTPHFPELEGHFISGNIINTISGKSITNENVVLSFVGKTAQCRFTKTDENGNFNFITNEQGIREIVIQPFSVGYSDFYVELSNPFPPVEINYQHMPFLLDNSKLAEINKAIISMQIKNIYDPFLPSKYSALSNGTKPDFFGEPDKTIQMSKFIELTSLKEVIKEIVPGVSTQMKNDKTNFKLINKYPNMSFDSAPLVLFDGVPVNNFDKVLNMSSRDIEKIDVLNTRYFVSDIVNEGILSFVSKKGNLSDLEFDKPVFRQEFETLQPAYHFNSPDYSTENLKNSRSPDFRNTLYWNSDMTTDKTGKSTVEFYTGDESGEFTVIVEGFTADGKYGKSAISFTVGNK